MEVLTALHRSAQTVGGVEDLIGETLGHRALATGPGEANEPAHGEGAGPTGADLDGHLIGGATDAAAAHLELRADVVDRALEGGDRLGAGLLLDDGERTREHVEEGKAKGKEKAAAAKEKGEKGRANAIERGQGKKRGFWQRMFGGDDAPAAETATE